MVGRLTGINTENSTLIISLRGGNCTLTYEYTRNHEQDERPFLNYWFEINMDLAFEVHLLPDGIELRNIRSTRLF